VTGGVSAATVPDLVALGARHFVVVRALTEASNPKRAARELRATIDGAIGALGG
jgi:thiamine-phosphate pyrophosphorylase